MRYGLDPRFRFLICRAIYKGMLRYICFQNKQEPIVTTAPTRSSVYGARRNE